MTEHDEADAPHETAVRERAPRATAKSNGSATKAVAAEAGLLRHALVTGYPGFIAKRLVRVLLNDFPRARLTVLVQERFRHDAEVEIGRLASPQQRRITLAIGDVTKMDLGLSGPEIEALTHDVTHVFHLAASQSLGVTREEAEAVNVGGVRNVLAVAREMPALARLVHFSTCYVSGAREGVVAEDELDVGQSFRNPYEETKCRAEKLMRTAMTDLPITVVRPSIVIGNSEPDSTDRLDGIYAMGILVVTSPITVPLPLPGVGSAPLPLVPIDFVVRATLVLALGEKAAGGTFHLVDPNPLSARHVYELVAKRAGRRLGRLSRRASLLTKVMRLPIFQRFSREQAQALDILDQLTFYNCAQTQTLLEGRGIACPRLDTYVDDVMRFVSGALKRERRGRRSSAALPADPFDG